MVIQNPVHPGAIVRKDCLTSLGLSVTEAAKRPGVDRQALSSIVNEKSTISIKWLIVYRKHLVRRQQSGYVCSLHMILPNRRAWKKRSK